MTENKKIKIIFNDIGTIILRYLVVSLKMAAHIENLMSNLLLDFSKCSSKPEEFLKYIHW